MADVLLTLKSRFDGKAFVEARNAADSLGNGMSASITKSSQAMNAVSVATLTLKGNFTNAATQAMKLAENMKLVSAGALAFAGIGLVAVKFGLEWLAEKAKKAQEELQKLSDARTDPLAESAKKTAEAYAEVEATLRRISKLNDVFFKLEDTVAAGSDKADSLALERERQKALAAAPDKEARDAINKEYDRKKAVLELDQKQAAIERERDQQAVKAAELADRRAKAEEQAARLLEQEAAIAAERKKWSNALAEGTEQRKAEGEGNNDRGRWLDRVMDALGMQTSGSVEKWEDFEKRVQGEIEKLDKAAGDVRKAIESNAAKAEDIGVEQKALEVGDAKVAAAQAELDARRELLELESRATDAAEEQEAAAKRLADAEEARKKAADELARKEQELARAKEAEARREEEAIKRRLDSAREIAGLTVDDNIARRKAARDAEKAAAKEERKAARLEDDAARGVILSKKDAEWLAARREIQQAQARMAKDQAALAAREKARQDAADANLKRCADDVAALKDKLTTLLTVQ